MSSGDAIVTCPRCLLASSRDAIAAFCSRCGLPTESAEDTGPPIQITSDSGQQIVIGRRLAFGDLCNLYHCKLPDQTNGVFKIARTHLANSHVLNELQTLQTLRDADAGFHAAPFLPQPLHSIMVQTSSAIELSQAQEHRRVASVLVYHAGISGPNELYTIEEVLAAYPNGIDGRDVAWMWRRLLTILSFVHEQRISHGAVTPDHVLIEPREHKLVLIGWCGATPFGAEAKFMAQRWRNWSNWENGASVATDIAAAAKTMSYSLQPGKEPAIVRHFERAAESRCDAAKLLNDFDKLIDALWGPRQYREFIMPQRTSL